MQNVQEVFNHIREMKKEQKDLRDMYKDALVQSYMNGVEVWT